MVDIHHFLAVFVHQRVGHRPADPLHFLEVDRALVVGVVQLGRPGQRIVPRRIHVVGKLALRDPHVVPLDLIEERPVALDRTGLLERPHHLVVARFVEGFAGPTGRNRAEYRGPLIAFVIPELVFLLLLHVDRHGNREGEGAEIGSLGRDPEAAALCRRNHHRNQCQRDEPCSSLHGQNLLR